MAWRRRLWSVHYTSPFEHFRLVLNIATTTKKPKNKIDSAATCDICSHWQIIIWHKREMMGDSSSDRERVTICTLAKRNDSKKKKNWKVQRNENILCHYSLAGSLPQLVFNKKIIKIFTKLFTFFWRWHSRTKVNHRVDVSKAKKKKKRRNVYANYLPYIPLIKLNIQKRHSKSLAGRFGPTSWCTNVVNAVDRCAHRFVKLIEEINDYANKGIIAVAAMADPRPTTPTTYGENSNFFM